MVLLYRTSFWASSVTPLSVRHVPWRSETHTLSNASPFLEMALSIPRRWNFTPLSRVSKQMPCFMHMCTLWYSGTITQGFWVNLELVKAQQSTVHRSQTICSAFHRTWTACPITSKICCHVTVFVVLGWVISSIFCDFEVAERWWGCGLLSVKCCCLSENCHDRFTILN